MYELLLKRKENRGILDTARPSIAATASDAFADSQGHRERATGLEDSALRQ